jgi:Targeting protein for Xklp2 (TPX2) domain
MGAYVKYDMIIFLVLIYYNSILSFQLEEEEEMRRLRKELVPKAQPMPFFDCPFIPKR